IIQLFEKQVAKTPHHAAVVFGGLHIDYEQLNRQADRIAALLREKGVKIGSIVGIKGEHSDWIIAGILGVLKTGGAYLPMQVEDPPERLRFMLNDSKAVVLIAQEYFAQEMLAQAAAVSQENIVLIEALAENVKDMRDIRVDEEPAAQARPDEPAYVIYTSGTTGAPKGVPVSHRNLVNYICWAARTYVKDEPVNFPLYTSIAFDLTVTSIFTPLVTGNSVIVYAGGNKRALIEEIVDEDRVEVIKLTPSHLKLLKYKKLSAKGVRLKRLILGGENLGVSEAREIHEKFNGAVEIYNEYGPTEATVGCMIHKFNPENDNRESVPIGIPISNSRIYLLTDSQEPVPVGAKGELYISGDGVARGYLNRPGFTAEKFIPDPFCPGNIMYRSGDLASRSLDGNFEFSGRIDDQVKIRGFRVELGEIETRLASFPGVKEAVVLAQEEEKGDKYLCAFVVSDDKNTVSELREYLTKELPDYMIPSYFVPLEKIPLTPNGKIDRKALPKTQLKAGENYIAPRNEIEKKLVELWAEILGRESLPASQLEKSIGINDNFFQLGGHSLKATVLVSKIHREFNVKVPLVEIFKTPILREMASLIANSGKTTSMEVEAIEQKEYYELSYNQKRLWFISQLDTTRSSFNMPGRIELKHPVEEVVIRKTIYQLVQRHESLRTGFKRIHGEPVQYVKKEVEIPFEMLDISMLADEKKQIRRELLFAQVKNASFDLNVAPLIRFTLIKVADAYYDFIFNMHHIISDGWSMEILKKEFYLFYEGCRSGNDDKSEHLTLQYKDYTAWHNKQLSNTLRQEQSRRFWREKLREGVPSLELPVTYTGDKDDFAGAGFRCILNKEAKEKLENLAQNTGSTLFMVMFSLYLMLLSRLANKEDVVCSIISAGREEANLQNIVGFFVNSILFSAKVDWKESFIDFINRVKTDTVEVYQHQYYPIEVVFKELKMKYPDIPASFNMENFRDEFVSPGVGVDGMNGLKPGHLDDLQDVKFDLEVYVSEYEDRMFLHWAYKKSLFNPATIEYIVNLYMELVDFFKDNFRESYASYKNRKKQDGFTRNN
ncbi:MAG: hypothetical protein QG657_5180, partial [Acidobacteriota bacterium]|nr:hypothetical protein [Acidobacteriota bacterium]